MGLGGSSTNPQAVWLVARRNDEAGNTWTELAKGEFDTEVQLREKHTLSLAWDNGKLIFRCDEETREYEPPGSVHRPCDPWRSLGLRNTRLKSGGGAFVAARFDNVVVSREGPDLVGEWVVGPTQTCKKRCKISGKMKVSNIGTQKAPRASFLNFYLSEDQVWDEGDLFLKQVGVGALKPGKSVTKRFNYKLPLDLTATGLYVIGVVDATALVEETNEENNVAVGGPIP